MKWGKHDIVPFICDEIHALSILSVSIPLILLKLSPSYHRQEVEGRDIRMFDCIYESSTKEEQNYYR